MWYIHRSKIKKKPNHPFYFCVAAVAAAVAVAVAAVRSAKNRRQELHNGFNNQPLSHHDSNSAPSYLLE